MHCHVLVTDDVKREWVGSAGEGGALDLTCMSLSFGSRLIVMSEAFHLCFHFRSLKSLPCKPLILYCVGTLLKQHTERLDYFTCFSQKACFNAPSVYYLYFSYEPCVFFEVDIFPVSMRFSAHFAFHTIGSCKALLKMKYC